MNVEIRNLGKSYFLNDREIPVLHNLSLDIKKGDLISLTGPSGVGKSTLLDILMGLIEPQDGGVYIDGERITGDKLLAWRAAIGYVPQDVYLTDTTPTANIAFGVDEMDIDMERVVAAARAARIHDFIASLPGQYQAPIGERGAQFSGGQRQRIGIARALYRRVSVLILDEATSALDNVTQADILATLKSVTGERTVIMVTHRSETIVFADRVIRLDARDEPATNPPQY